MERMSQEGKERKIAAAIFNAFLESGQWVTAQEIADRIGWNVQRVRSTISKSGGGFSLLVDRAKDTRPGGSNFSGPDFVMVMTYAPSREYLANAIRRSQRGAA